MKVWLLFSYSPEPYEGSDEYFEEAFASLNSLVKTLPKYFTNEYRKIEAEFTWRLLPDGSRYLLIVNDYDYQFVVREVVVKE